MSCQESRGVDYVHTLGRGLGRTGAGLGRTRKFSGERRIFGAWSPVRVPLRAHVAPSQRPFCSLTVDSRPNSAVRVPVLVAGLGLLYVAGASSLSRSPVGLSYNFMGERGCSYMTVVRVPDLARRRRARPGHTTIFWHGCRVGPKHCWPQALMSLGRAGPAACNVSPTHHAGPPRGHSARSTGSSSCTGARSMPEKPSWTARGRGSPG